MKMKLHDAIPGYTPRTRHDWDKLAKRARKHPGKWVEYPTEVHPSHAWAINTGKVKAFRPTGAFTAKVVDVTPPYVWKGPDSVVPAQRAILYVCFNGDPAVPDTPITTLDATAD